MKTETKTVIYAVSGDEWYPVAHLQKITVTDRPLYGDIYKLPEKEAQAYIRAVARFEKALSRINDVIRNSEKL